ncbi:hypothetical protein LHP98_11765 [Rhodobacter sp. Har01]|uniref:hypothetical protein n=1 Tax=Rhodobacter sp. Har01 TaxID=2883999 RepID=UPI001D089478|nr:hypothetical protein [Rhodobacter sp. Har01]MCB6178803.1 hypothetical protein [Rhodobacter sp. Har01]
MAILTAAEPQTRQVAMILTMNAIGKGAEAHILLRGPAADIALKEAPASATTTTGQPPKDGSPQGLLQTMIAKNGIKARDCAICLPDRGAGFELLTDAVAPGLARGHGRGTDRCRHHGDQLLIRPGPQPGILPDWGFTACVLRPSLEAVHWRFSSCPS